MPTKKPARKAREPSVIVSMEAIESQIYLVRGERVMLDSDLAALYGVETGALNRAVKRNADRFPPSFVFQVDESEYAGLRCQSGISKGRGGRRYMPFVFTEHGALMLASVLNSQQAIQVSIQVVDAFVRLRHTLAANASLAKKVEQLSEKVDLHDGAIAVLFDEIRKLVEKAPEEEPKRRIGFHPKK